MVCDMIITGPLKKYLYTFKRKIDMAENINAQKPKGNFTYVEFH